MHLDTGKVNEHIGNYFALKEKEPSTVAKKLLTLQPKKEAMPRDRQPLEDILKEPNNEPNCVGYNEGFHTIK